MKIPRHKTALARSELSRPLRLAIEHGLINPSLTLLDYGCGRGGDVRRLRKRGISAKGWDPNHYPDGDRSPADVVNLGYVVNVIEDVTERAEALRSAWDRTQQLLVISAQLRSESRVKPVGSYADGCLTSAGTFQKYYDQSELRDWISATLGTEPVAAAPGVFYVFSERGLREDFLATRFRRREASSRVRKSDQLYEAHRQLLDPLAKFFERRGRLPAKEEADEFSDLINVFGSVRRAWRVVVIATGSEQWDGIERQCAQDMLIYLALARIRGRPRFGELPARLQRDVRCFFGSYKEGEKLGDELLFAAGRQDAINHACRHAGFGKLMPNALYVHASAVESLPILLRVYEGCARTYIGSVDGANVVKLHRHKPQVSYLSYPEFDEVAHPSLAASMVVPLSSFDVRYTEYHQDANPPILHRKEDFVPDGYPNRELFQALTRAEEEAGLLGQGSPIGRRADWETLLERSGFSISGHALVGRR